MLTILDEKGKPLGVQSIPESFAEGKKVIVDLGTGNGRFSYLLAKSMPENAVIGIDPVALNLEEYWKKARKNLHRQGQRNLLYVIASAENLDPSLHGIAQEIYVNFPWGSLLEGIVKGQAGILRGIAALGQKGTPVHLHFSYSSLHDAGEIARRKLPFLTPEYILGDLKEAFLRAGLEILSLRTMEGEELKEFGSHWSKILYLGKSRDVYALECVVS